LYIIAVAQVYGFIVLDGVMASMLAIGPKVRRFNPSRGDGYRRAIKIHSMPAFRGEIKPEAHVVRF
jgi:hypothetical protein